MSAVNEMIFHYFYTKNSIYLQAQFKYWILNLNPFISVKYIKHEILISALNQYYILAELIHDLVFSTASAGLLDVNFALIR